ncbi:S8 family peptidase [Sphingomonas sp. GB1N7]|uniref:S8 family peptidase n=1 Tax=Parasphingomonas caseinilytica TaxID=3096158 RepID=UPI002FC5FEF6
MNALAAYQANATGAGIRVGIIDSGIDAGSPEFAGRISTASTNVAGGTGTDDESGHGTAVAFTIAGTGVNVNAQGVAFNASLIVLRTDTPGTCAATDGCSFADSAIARGIDAATTGGARVINLSLGGSSPNSSVVSAINRATAAGVIIVISAGNDAAADPDLFAQIASNTAVSRGLVIIAGSVGTSNTISSFSNLAGNFANYYLAAVGESVRAPCENVNVCLWRGTSLSAPQISGAVALLAQAFPNLTSSQIVSILYSSARDAGTAGVDSTYGRGILDLTRAFQPLGTTSVAGGTGAISLTSNATLSAPMGDAAQGALGTVILDGYSRAFAIDLAHTINRVGIARNFLNSLQSSTRNIASSINGMAVQVTLASTPNGGVSVERLMLSPGDGQRARAIAGIVTQRLGSSAQFAMGFAQGSSTLAAQLVGRRDPAFLVAREPLSDQGFDSRTKGSAALRNRFGAWGMTASMESGEVLNPGDAGALATRRANYRRSGYDRTAVSLDRQDGALATGLSFSRLGERDTVLGAHFGNAFGATRATSWFVDAVARLEAGGGWYLGGSMRQGWTSADVRGGLSGSGLIRTDAFAADLGKDGLFARGDSFGLRVAQPLRVSRGGLDLRLPTNYDYATGTPDAWLTQRLNLAPTGRELNFEARYSFGMLGGTLQTNLFWRRDPGNYVALPDDRGGALRFAVAF